MLFGEPKFSQFVLHRVLNIPKKGIVLSSKTENRTYTRYNNTRTYKVRVDTYPLEVSDTHNDKLIYIYIYIYR